MKTIEKRVAALERTEEPPAYGVTVTACREATDEEVDAAVKAVGLKPAMTIRVRLWGEPHPPEVVGRWPL